MNSNTKLTQLCVASLQSKNIYNAKYKERFKNELIEIDVNDKYDYFLKLRDKVIAKNLSGTIPNENNLLVPYLLGISSSFNIDEESSYTIGEFPDIDVDYLPPVRDYLKQEWAPATYGNDYVCSIGSYTTYDLKNSIIDMARVFAADHREILDITTQIGSKDDDGDKLTWDAAIDIYPAFAKYVENNP